MLVDVLAAALPDPSSLEIAGTFAFVAAFLGSLVALLRGDSWDDARLSAFKYGFWGTAAGFATFLFGLVTGVY